jgi:hypothetical protein
MPTCRSRPFRSTRSGRTRGMRGRTPISRSARLRTASVADALKDCSRRNGLVLDPFAGSGTVLIAAERIGRRARALEIAPHYVDVAVRRWQDYTGKVALLTTTGQTFEDIGDERGRAGTMVPTAAIVVVPG